MTTVGATVETIYETICTIMTDTIKALSYEEKNGGSNTVDRIIDEREQNFSMTMWFTKQIMDHFNDDDNVTVTRIDDSALNIDIPHYILIINTTFTPGSLIHSIFHTAYVKNEYNLSPELMCQVENNRLLDATIDEVKNSAQDMISHVTKLYNGDSNNNKKVTAWDIADQSVTKAKSYSKNINPKMQSKYYARSEERRVGKECRSRWSPYH